MENWPNMTCSELIRLARAPKTQRDANARRAARAAAALEAYTRSDPVPGELVDEGLSDLLCDLRHLASLVGIDAEDFALLVGRSLGNWIVEREEEQSEA